MKLTFNEWLRWLKIKNFKMECPVLATHKEESVFINISADDRINKINLN